MKRLFGLLAGTVFALVANAQGAGAPKIAISSLVADSITVTLYEQRTGSNVPKPRIATYSLPEPVLDIALLQAARKAAAQAVPQAAVFPLKVPTAGSSVDPAAVVADDEKVVAGNVLVTALKQQGFTHLITATKYHGPNQVQLRNGVVGTEQGFLDGLGFYVDPVIRVQDIDTGERATGIVAPYVYVQLRLIDLASMQVAATQTITATRSVSSAHNKTGVDAWGALTADEKVDALHGLIDRYVAAAVPLLFQAK